MPLYKLVKAISNFIEYISCALGMPNQYKNIIILWMMKFSSRTWPENPETISWFSSAHEISWLFVALYSVSINQECIYEPIYLAVGQGEMLTKTSVWCWRSSANFEGCWRERIVMEWAGKDCDSSIESGGARWIRLICLWIGLFHYSC